MIFFVGSLFVSAVMAAASGGESWKYMLFHNGPFTDMYMDFFNSIRDGGSPDVYSARNNIYPPLCVLIFRIFSKLIDFNWLSKQKFKNSYLSFPFLVAGIPTLCVYNSRLKQLATDYNEGHRNQDVSLSFGGQNNGIGFALNF